MTAPVSTSSRSSSSTSSRGPSSPFPSPLSFDPADPSWQDEDGSVLRVEGKCAPFCGNEAGTTQDVRDHGDACTSWNALVLARVDTRTGRVGHISTGLAVPYLHGVYSSQDARTVEDRGYVRMAVDNATQDSEFELCLTPEQARTIAASLYRLAAEVETVGQDGGR